MKKGGLSTPLLFPTISTTYLVTFIIIKTNRNESWDSDSGGI